MKNIGIITAAKSDLSVLVEQTAGCYVQYINPAQITDYNLSFYDALWISFDKEEMVLDAASRMPVEEFLNTGKKVFTEFVNSSSNLYSAPAVSTRFKRLLYVGGGLIPGLEDGDILDEQCNSFLMPYSSGADAVPLLVYRDFINSHDKSEVTDEDRRDGTRRALWLETPSQMVCAFRLSNLVRARFAPFRKWDAVAAFIINWLTGAGTEGFALRRHYSLDTCSDADFEQKLEASINLAVRWYDDAGMLQANGKKGVREGLGTEIYPDGTQKTATIIRNDCCGETSMAFFAHWLITKNPVSMEKSNNLENFCLKHFLIKDGMHKGMMRWSEIAWGVLYQDDAARVLIPFLLKALYTGDKGHLPACGSALDYLVKTTGTDGLRVWRTDIVDFTDEGSLNALGQNPADLLSPHYNAYYLAALLLAGKVTGEQKYKDTGIRGMESLMKAYPNVRFEVSETEGLCRMVLPLAFLYWSTGEERHREYLYRVCGDLQKMKHPSGGYLEWDSNSTALLSHTQNAECSLLTKNGDPVVEQLYALNWLPLGFIQAYFVTGDSYFYGLWKEICTFFIKTQLHSDDPKINGAWTRGFDVDKMEVFGLPNDIGWGPWSIESGWTLGEIVPGMAFGLLADELKKYY